MVFLSGVALRRTLDINELDTAMVVRVGFRVTLKPTEAREFNLPG